MRTVSRSIFVAILCLLGAVAVAVTSAVAAVAEPVVGFVIGGTGRPAPAPPYVTNVMNRYVYPFSHFCTSSAVCTAVPIHTTETFWPIYGGWEAPTFNTSVAQGVDDLEAAVRAQLGQAEPIAGDPNSKIHILAYSQSGRVMNDYLRRISAPGYVGAPTTEQLEITIIGNWSRPNGGIGQRFEPFTIPLLDVTFGGAIPNDLGYKMTDISYEYDPISDFPLYIMNPVSVLNSMLAFQYIHGSYPDPSNDPIDYPYPWGFPPPNTDADLAAVLADPANQQHYPVNDPNADNLYILIPSTRLPLLQPVRDLGTAYGLTPVVEPLMQLIEPATRVVVDADYNRDIPFGQATRAQIIPQINPVTFTEDLLAAAVEGVENAFGDLDAPTTSLAASAKSSSAKTSSAKTSSAKTSSATTVSAKADSTDAPTATTAKGDK